MNLVVGASGLIGAALLRELHRRGLPAQGTSRGGGAGLLPLDLARAREAPLPPGIALAFLCGGVTGLGACAADPRGTAAINVVGTAELAARLAHSGAKLVFLSSSLVFSGCGSRRATDATDPCCEYGAQKASAESLLPAGSAVVRLTKVVESLGERMSFWASSLVSGKRVEASSALRFSPLPLRLVADLLAGFSGSFAPGIFQMSPPDDLSYLKAAESLADRLGASRGLVADAPSPGLDLYWRFPASATIVPHAPPGASGWRFPSSGGTLSDFLTDMAPRGTA